MLIITVHTVRLITDTVHLITDHSLYLCGPTGPRPKCFRALHHPGGESIETDPAAGVTLVLGGAVVRGALNHPGGE